MNPDEVCSVQNLLSTLEPLIDYMVLDCCLVLVLDIVCLQAILTDERALDPREGRLQNYCPPVVTR